MNNVEMGVSAGVTAGFQGDGESDSWVLKLLWPSWRIDSFTNLFVSDPVDVRQPVLVPSQMTSYQSVVHNNTNSLKLLEPASDKFSCELTSWTADKPGKGYYSLTGTLIGMDLDIPWQRPNVFPLDAVWDIEFTTADVLSALGAPTTVSMISESYFRYVNFIFPVQSLISNSAYKIKIGFRLNKADDRTWFLAMWNWELVLGWDMVKKSPKQEDDWLAHDLNLDLLFSNSCVGDWELLA